MVGRTAATLILALMGATGNGGGPGVSTDHITLTCRGASVTVTAEAQVRVAAHGRVDVSVEEVTGSTGYVDFKGLTHGAVMAEVIRGQIVAKKTLACS